MYPFTLRTTHLPNLRANIVIVTLSIPAHKQYFYTSKNTHTFTMSLKAVRASQVPNLDQPLENESLALCSTRFSQGVEFERSAAFKPAKFLVVGHRGNGMNVLQSLDEKRKSLKENSIMSFNAAANLPFPADFIEFDVQVTKDGCPVIFHDDFILSREEHTGLVFEKRLTDLSLAEFLSYGPQPQPHSETSSSAHHLPLLRKTEDGRIVDWAVATDDPLCTLQQAFERVNPSVGFNIELKFDDYTVYQQHHLITHIQAVLQVVFDYANNRPIIFSTFQPDAALLLKKMLLTPTTTCNKSSSNYPVFFLTDGGVSLYPDPRRNSLEEALNLCLEGGLEGIVSHVSAIFANPVALHAIKQSNLSLLTYGKLNNVEEAVHMQHLMGIDGVIVDDVQQITHAVSNMLNPSQHKDQQIHMHNNPKFSDTELSFLLKLIPQLINNK